MESASYGQTRIHLERELERAHKRFGALEVRYWELVHLIRAIKSMDAPSPEIAIVQHFDMELSQVAPERKQAEAEFHRLKVFVAKLPECCESCQGEGSVNSKRCAPCSGSGRKAAESVLV